MVQGAHCCGAFISKNGIIIAAVLSAASLIVAIIVLSIGIAESCDHFVGCSEKHALTVNGGILTAISIIFILVTIGLFCNMNNFTTTTSILAPQPIMLPQHYANYANPIVVSTTQASPHPPPPYPQANMGYPQQPQQYPQASPQTAMSPGPRQPDSLPPYTSVSS